MQLHQNICIDIIHRMKKSRKTKKTRRRQRKTRKMQKGGSIFAVILTLVILSKFSSVLESNPVATPAGALPNLNLPIIVAAKTAGPDASIYDVVEQYRNAKGTSPVEKGILEDAQKCFQQSVSSAQGLGHQNPEDSTYDRCFVSAAQDYAIKKKQHDALGVKQCFETGSDRCLNGNEKVFNLKLSIIDDKLLIGNEPHINVDDNLDFTLRLGNIQLEGFIYDYFEDGFDPKDLKTYVPKIVEMARNLVSNGNKVDLLSKIEGSLYFSPIKNTAVIVNGNKVIKVEMPADIFRQTQLSIER